MQGLLDHLGSHRLIVGGRVICYQHHLDIIANDVGEGITMIVTLFSFNPVYLASLVSNEVQKNQLKGALDHFLTTTPPCC